MLNFLWDMHQQSRINEASRRIADTASEARHSARRTEEAARRVEALTLTTMAMWSILSEKLGVTEEQLEERMRELDLRDGRLDGKVSTSPAKCAACGRTLSPAHARCVYCGGEVNVKPFGGA